MAKKNKDNVIALEIAKYSKKILEFQTYLEKNDINQIELDITKDKYKESDMQIKLMNALPAWLEALKKLKQEAEEAAGIELRGDAEMNDVFKHMKKL